MNTSSFIRKGFREYRGLLAFVALMVVFRSAIADYNVVPSGSMMPSVLIGDRILVDKMAYDLRVPLTHVRIARLNEPKRGDIVTVDSKEAGELLLKRVVGLPGDVVELRDNVLYLNGVAVRYAPAKVAPLEGDTEAGALYRDEMLGTEAHLVRLSQTHPSLRSSFGPVVVPPDHYMALGDNRDNSADSRYYGFFSRAELMGRVKRIAFSLDSERAYRPRFDRTGMLIDPVQGSAVQ